MTWNPKSSSPNVFWVEQPSWWHRLWRRLVGRPTSTTWTNTTTPMISRSSGKVYFEFNCDGHATDADQMTYKPPKGYKPW